MSTNTETNQEDDAAYQANCRCFTPGLEPVQVINNYADWAKTYERSLCPGRYNGPEMAAEELACRVSVNLRQSVSILDVAAGTGMVGVELVNKGFTNVDALEPCEAMLEELSDKGIYSTKYKAFLGLGHNDVPSNAYDVVVIVGGMGEGHVPVGGIDDMIRITKAGGLVIIVMRREYLYEVEQYKDKLEPHMDLMQQLGYWVKLERKVVQNYAFGKEGIIFTYKVL